MLLFEQYIGRFTADSPEEFVVAKTGGDVGDRQVSLRLVSLLDWTCNEATGVCK
jgi:hypothetical protein